MNYPSASSGVVHSSCGPDFKSITYDGTCLRIECSPVQFIRLVGPGYFGWHTGSYDGELLTQVCVEISTSWDHIYLEIEDKDRKRAWSNTLFVTKQYGE